MSDRIVFPAADPQVPPPLIRPEHHAGAERVRFRRLPDDAGEAARRRPPDLPEPTPGRRVLERRSRAPIAVAGPARQAPMERPPLLRFGHSSAPYVTQALAQEPRFEAHGPDRRLHADGAAAYRAALARGATILGPDNPIQVSA